MNAIQDPWRQMVSHLHTVGEVQAVLAAPAPKPAFRSRHARDDGGISGVFWDEDREQFRVSLNAFGRRHHLGQTPDFFEACCRRKSAENRFLTASERAPL